MDAYTESSGIETSPEMNLSFEPRIHVINSPEPKVKPRKLMFNLSPCATSDDDEPMPPKPLLKSPNKLSIPPLSPPYRRIRKLRLFDSPATPKSILQKSTVLHSHPLNPLMIGRGVEHNHSSSKISKFLSTNNNVITSELGLSAHHSVGVDLNETPDPCDNHRAISITEKPKHLRANMNPFTPQSLMMRTKKRIRVEDELNSSAPVYTFGASSSFIRNSAAPAKASASDMLPLSLFDCDEEYRQAPKRIALQETNISRYAKEFVELDMIGSGEFGMVYQCLNRLDGCIYALKRSIKPVAGSAFE